jgi:hypothetical protein
MSPDEYAYYAAQSPITDPGRHAKVFDDVPQDVPALQRVARELVLHYRADDPQAHGVPDSRLAEIDSRDAVTMLDRLLALDDRPLTEETFVVDPFARARAAARVALPAAQPRPRPGGAEPGRDGPVGRVGADDRWESGRAQLRELDDLAAATVEPELDDVRRRYEEDARFRVPDTVMSFSPVSGPMTVASTPRR